VNSVGVLADSGGGLHIGKTKTPQRFGKFGISTRFPPLCFRLASLAENQTA
jgi:hypothetical protein